MIIVLMIAGTLSFGLHYELWRGRRRELFENLETRSLAVTATVTTTLCLLGLARAGAFTDLTGLFRKGVCSRPCRPTPGPGSRSTSRRCS
ncbi:MAG: hypothetical protein GWN48_17130 [Actinobacteria bacterium]|nr:hypothetical protein [Actinomycetota bacterium]